MDPLPHPCFFICSSIDKCTFLCLKIIEIFYMHALIYIMLLNIWPSWSRVFKGLGFAILWNAFGMVSLLLCFASSGFVQASDADPGAEDVSLLLPSAVLKVEKPTYRWLTTQS